MAVSAILLPGQGSQTPETRATGPEVPSGFFSCGERIVAVELARA